MFCVYMYICTQNMEERSGPMCMHAGSLLQKNAPIFGNVFTVTFNLHAYNACT